MKKSLKSLNDRKEKMMSKMSIAQLCDAFEHTNSLKIDEYVAMTRGWIADELEKRNKELFDAWIDTDNLNLLDTPSEFFK
jgi:hypothetical protein